MVTRAIRKQAGVTLVELMLGLVVLAVILGIGVPSFQNLMRNSEMTSRANSAIIALQLARSEAIRRGRPVTACPSSDAQTCGTNWGDGWIVFVDGNASGSSASVDEILRVDESDSRVTTDASPDFIRFLGNGMRDTSVSTGVQSVQLKRPDCGVGQGRELTVSPAGRANISKMDC
jgi:type IV fimbrial biogenesis protein FimT